MPGLTLLVSPVFYLLLQKRHQLGLSVGYSKMENIFNTGGTPAPSAAR